MKKLILVIADQNLGKVVTMLAGVTTEMRISDYIPSAGETPHRKAVVVDPIPGTTARVVVEPPATSLVQPEKRRVKHKEKFPRVSAAQSKEVYFRRAIEGPFVNKDIEQWARQEKINPGMMKRHHANAVRSGDVVGSTNGDKWNPHTYRVVKVTDQHLKALAKRFKENA
jgi:hypothetical protein